MSLKNVRVLNAVGATTFVVLCWLPSFGPGTNSWQIRLICILLLLPLTTATVYFTLLNIGEDRIQGKIGEAIQKHHEIVKKAFLKLLHLKESQKTTTHLQTLKRIYRVGIMIAALLFTVGISVPFEWSGLKALSGETLKSVSGQITDNNLTFGTWFLAQSISMGNKENQQDFYYFLGSEPIRVGQQYNFLMLPGYPIILQHTKIDEN